MNPKVILFLIFLLNANCSQPKPIKYPEHLTATTSVPIDIDAMSQSSYLLKIAQGDQWNTDILNILSFANLGLSILNSTDTEDTNQIKKQLRLDFQDVLLEANYRLTSAKEAATQPLDPEHDELHGMIEQTTILQNAADFSTVFLSFQRCYTAWKDTSSIEEHLEYIMENDEVYLQWLEISEQVLHYALNLLLDQEAYAIGDHLFNLIEKRSKLSLDEESYRNGMDDISIEKRIERGVLQSMSSFEVVLLRSLGSKKESNKETNKESLLSTKKYIRKVHTYVLEYNNWGSYATQLYRGDFNVSSVGSNIQNHSLHSNLSVATSTTKVVGPNLANCRSILCEANPFCNRTFYTIPSTTHLPIESSPPLPLSPPPFHMDNTCDIDIVDGTNMNAIELVELLLNKYIKSSRPVVLRNSSHTMRIDQSLNLKELLQNFGNSTVMSTRASDVVLRQSDLYDHPLIMSNMTTLNKYWNNSVLNDLSYATCDAAYVFQVMDEEVLNLLFTSNDVEIGDTGEQQIADEPPLPGTEMGIDVLGEWTKILWDSNRFSMPPDEWADAALFYIGSELSGTYFHSHTNALNVLFEGSKRWFLVPKKMWYGPTRIESLTDWYATIKPKLPFQPLECTQIAGDVLYVPSDWNHAILNLEDVVGLAVEIGRDRELKTESV